MIHFEDLVKDFLKDKNPPKKFKDNPDNNRAIFFEEDIEFQKEWEQFHQEKAKLRILHAKCNLKREY